MYNPNNPDELSENVSTDYIQKALFKTIEGHPHFKLNTSAVNSLDILPKLKPDGSPDNDAISLSRSNTTVFSVLNKCRTVSGQRLLATWLRHPLISKEHIDRRLDIVEYFVRDSEMRTTCYEDVLRKIPDLLKIACRISKEKCSILDLVKIYQASKLAENLCKSFQHVNQSNGTQSNVPAAVNELFNWIRESSVNLTDYQTILEESLELEKPTEDHEYLVKPQSNEDIGKICEELDNLMHRARAEYRRVADDVGLERDKGLKLEVDSSKGFVLRVSRQNEQAIRGNKDYIQSSQIKKDGYRFTTRSLSKLSDKYVGAKSEYNTIARHVYHDIISKAVMYEDQVLELSVVFTVLDVFVALSVAADMNSYARPLILEQDSGKIELERLRHPCIENQPDIENYVPNDINMSKFAKKFYIITGPNMGGKSTYIKSIAVGIIMAQCGSMIPAEDGKISIVDNVHTRIGAGDCQAKGISTFMEEMLDMHNILQNATDRSLVIIDELGRGTSTFDGFGLAWSITKHLAAQVKCYGTFATHFHELTEMENEVALVGNLHVKAYCQDGKLSMLYNVDRGICDESYGINVARFTQFPEHVVKVAEEKLKQFEEVPGFDNKQKVRDFVRECVKEISEKSNGASN